MGTSQLTSTTTIFAAYVLAFGIAAVLCVVSISRARQIENRDTRRGFVGLLLLSGGWAAAQVGYLVAPQTALKLVFYYVGLVVGFAAVGAWLYFCSAYTGRSLHRARSIRRVAVAVFLGIILVKVTNPFHNLYFQTEAATTPFPHLAIIHGLLHWVAMGLAYGLALVGYFMLFELFWRVGRDTKPLVALVSITALPVVFDVLGLVSPQLVNLTYSPLGVAIFAVGTLFVYLEQFETIRLAGEHDDPIVIVDADDQIRDYNTKAETLFPGLEVGSTIDAVAPEIAEQLDEEDAVLQNERAGGLRYYRLTVNPLISEQGLMAIILTDITEREQYRRQLEHKNERLEQFASFVSHDLRNPLNVASLRVDSARREYDSEDLDKASTALERMEALIEDLLTLTRQGQGIDEPETVTLSTVVNRAWNTVDTKAAILSVESDSTLKADGDRLRQLLENLFRNAIEHGSEDVTISVGMLSDTSGFYVADDGPGIPEEEREAVFEYGHSSQQDGTGLGLAIVNDIVAAHNWTISITDSTDGGTRFEIAGVEVTG